MCLFQYQVQDTLYGFLFLLENDIQDNTYNQEAIATLIQCMENYRDKLVVIFAGYTKEMQAFFDAIEKLEKEIKDVKIGDVVISAEGTKEKVLDNIHML